MKPPQRVLIVDDDTSAREWLAAFMTSRGLAPIAVGSGEEAIEEAKRTGPDLVTLDLGLPGMDGLETLRTLRAHQPRLAVLVLSGTGDTQAIVESVRLGAADFLRKPCGPEELDAALGKALQRGAAEEAGRIGFADGGIAPPPLFAGQSRKMRLVESMIDHVADTDITVLIRGESGTGKELVARTICARSRRARRAFVKVNCAALPSELLESELFGYEKGAFTGAQKRKLGKFEIANGGTI
ncbi:MAG TPA: sigma 54-interacting transcriptional regulator, partial [Myxococcota bacterium]|nr:sigma 54-interacting transcriptional regulator [Myxococcota bacterium]